MSNLTYRQQIAANLATCRACPFMRRKFLVGMTCGNLLHVPEKIEGTCGCAVTVKSILSFAFDCPKGFWVKQK